MLSCVVEHVDERVADLARRGEVAAVVAIAPDFSAKAARCDVEEAIRTNREALHAAGERILRVGLDDEVNVVGLYRVLDDAEVLATCRAHCAVECGEQQLLAKGRQSRDCS